MGLLGILGGRRSDEEEQIERDYVNIYAARGLHEREASSLVKRMIADVKTDIARYVKQPKPPTGDELLAKAQYDENLRARLSILRNEGVSDEDLRWWHNMTDLSRGMILQDDIFHHVTFTHGQAANGKTAEEGLKLVPTYFPIYGNPTDESKFKGDDRPLPIELKNRVNAYNISMTAQDPEGHKMRIERSTSFNALVRQAIKAGRL